jgi:hypothetical protein
VNAIRPAAEIVARMMAEAISVIRRNAGKITA